MQVTATASLTNLAPGLDVTLTGTVPEVQSAKVSFHSFPAHRVGRCRSRCSTLHRSIVSSVSRTCAPELPSSVHAAPLSPVNHEQGDLRQPLAALPSLRCTTRGTPCALRGCQARRQPLCQLLHSTPHGVIPGAAPMRCAAPRAAGPGLRYPAPDRQEHGQPDQPAQGGPGGHDRPRRHCCRRRDQLRHCQEQRHALERRRRRGARASAPPGPGG